MKKGFAPQSLHVAIDIGTTKICVLVGKKVGQAIEIIGIGKAPSDGLAKGIVVDIARAVKSIKAAKQEAELMAGIKIESAIIGISGSHIQSFVSQGMVPVKRGQIRQYDIAQVIMAAKAVSIPQDQQILHVLPQFFILDGEKLKDPNGMHGMRLEVQVNIITGAVTCVQNLIYCCQLADIAVDDIVLEPLASASAVLSEDEKELGVAMLDIGGGTSDFVIYTGGNLRYAFVLPIAGNHFTHDLAICLRTPIKDAERLKIEHGFVGLKHVVKNEVTALMMHGEQEQLVQADEMSEILSARAHEMFSIIKNDLYKHELYDQIVAGLVLTGGGSQLDSLDVFASDILNMPVRIGEPRMHSLYKESLTNPKYATGYGLLQHALDTSGTSQLDAFNAPLISRVFWRMKSWVSDFF